MWKSQLETDALGLESGFKENKPERVNYNINAIFYYKHLYFLRGQNEIYFLYLDNNCKTT